MQNKRLLSKVSKLWRGPSNRYLHVVFSVCWSLIIAEQGKGEAVSPAPLFIGLKSSWILKSNCGEESSSYRQSFFLKHGHSYCRSHWTQPWKVLLEKAQVCECRHLCVFLLLLLVFDRE